MARRGHTSGQEITKPRETEVALAQRQSVAQVCRALGVTEQTYYRWRKEMRRRPGRPGSGGPSSWRAKTRGCGGRWPTWRSPTGSCGKRAGGGPSGPDSSAEGRHAGAAGVGGPVASGLPGVGPAPIQPALPCSCAGRGGGALEPRSCGWPRASGGTATGGSRGVPARGVCW